MGKKGNMQFCNPTGVKLLLNYDKAHANVNSHIDV